jgi:hypothetical protein
LVSAPFHVGFDGGRTAVAVRVDRPSDIPVAVGALGFHGSRRVIVLVGGAGGLNAGDLDRLRPLFEQALVPVAERFDASVVDGGTDAGVMHLIGRARSRAAATFWLIGVAAAGTVSFPGSRPQREDVAPLDPHHPHFVLVPGAEWGAESSWIAQVGTELAGGLPSVTMLVNGGEIAYADVEHSLRAGRPVLVIASSGRTAEQLVSAVRGATPADERVIGLAASGLIRVVDGDPGSLERALAAALQ